MKEFIDKADVVVAIKTIYNEDYKFLPSDLVESVQDFKDDLLMALDGLYTVKEVDLDKEIEKEIETRWYGEYLSTEKFKESAKHFFELGIKAQKGE